MSRRQQNPTDDSTATDVSITGSLKSLIINNWGAANVLVYGEAEMNAAGPEVILRRMLSTKSAISTKSSLAEANQRARDEITQQFFSSIGQGQCGTVYALKGTTMVVKLPNSSNKTHELFGDFQVHELVYEALSHVYPSKCSNVNVPKLEMWVNAESDHFWSAKRSWFGPDVKVPNYGLVSERIYSLPQPVREAIVDALCPKEIAAVRDTFLKKPENKDCLLRLYLGRRYDNRTSKPQNIRMRNFPLHVDEMERLGLETKNFACAMAEALSLLHWKAGVDANDVEFVLGSTPVITGRPTREEIRAADKDSAADLYFSDFEHRTISLWLLDFNECKRFEHNAAGLQRLIRGFWFNDPYYPRPCSKNAKDRELWNLFSSHYLKVSDELIAGDSGPQMFIDGVVAEGKKRGASSLFG